jgi:hypothetical protein
MSGTWLVGLTRCVSAAGAQARPRTNLRSTARGVRAVAERRLAPSPARRLHARVRPQPLEGRLLALEAVWERQRRALELRHVSYVRQPAYAVK